MCAYVCAQGGGGEGGVDKTAPRLQRDFVKRLNEIMQSLRYNENVDCQGLNLGDQGMAYVGEAFAYNDALKVVDLSSNGIGPDGAYAYMCVCVYVCVRVRGTASPQSREISTKVGVDSALRRKSRSRETGSFPKPT